MPRPQMSIPNRADKPQVTGYEDAAGLATCLKDSEIVIIPAGVPRKPGMTRDGWSTSIESYPIGY